MVKELRSNRDMSYTEKPPFPRNMLVELANICNHRCVFCGYRNMTRKKRECDKQFTFELIKQAYDNGAREIGFYMIGEPFVKQDLEDYVAYANGMGFEYIYLTSNGALADIKRLIRLAEAGLSSIKFSVNAATPGTYKRIHGEDDYITVKANIAALREFVTRNNVDLPIFISFVKTTVTENDLEAIHEEFDNLVDKIYIYECANQGGSMHGLIDAGYVRAGELKSGTTPCDMVFNRIHITCEGYLDACCADVNGLLAAVDLHTMSLKDAWYSDTMINLRRQFIHNKLRNIVCYNCVNNTDISVVPLNPDLYLSKGAE